MSKKIDLMKLVEKLDKELLKEYDAYLEHHKQLDAYRGKQFSDNEEVKIVNNILKDIQQKFAAIYPVLHFIATRYEFANNTVTSYNDFIESLKKSGAHQEGIQTKE